MTYIIDISWFQNVNPSKESMYMSTNLHLIEYMYIEKATIQVVALTDLQTKWNSHIKLITSAPEVNSLMEWYGTLNKGDHQRCTREGH